MAFYGTSQSSLVWMDERAEVQQRVELALAQSKRVVKEARISVQQLARLRDDLQPEEAQGHGSTEEDS